MGPTQKPLTKYRTLGLHSSGYGTLMFRKNVISLRVSNLLPLHGSFFRTFSVKLDIVQESRNEEPSLEESARSDWTHCNRRVHSMSFCKMNKLSLLSYSIKGEIEKTHTVHKIIGHTACYMSMSAQQTFFWFLIQYYITIKILSK